MSAPVADASAFPAPAAQPAPERPPRPAATIVVVRDGAAGIEVLLSRRADGTDYTSGAWVFPGGIVDPRDRDAHAACFGTDEPDIETVEVYEWGTQAVSSDRRKTPLPSGERPGEGSARSESPLTPTLSPEGRGSYATTPRLGVNTATASVGASADAT